MMLTITQMYLVFGCLIALAAGIGVLRYRTPLNPLTYFAVVDVGIFILFAAIGAQYFQESQSYGESAAVKTIWISIVYLVGAVMSYFVNVRGLLNIYANILHRIRFDTETIPEKFSPLVILILLISSMLCFSIVAVFGHGGMLWITDTRSAYISYRNGVGVFWMLFQWFLVSALLYVLWTRRPTGIRLVGILVLALFAFYFTGSKSLTLLALVIGILYFHFRVHMVSALASLLVFSGLAVAIFAVLVLQGSYATMAEGLQYFGSGGYFDTTAQIINRFNEFGYQYGYAYLSSLWFYVPRSLFPGKPYEYGALLFYGTLFPGMAETGNTPGNLVWTLDYINFGIIAVFISGYVRSLIQRVVYEYYVKNKTQLFAFILVCQISFMPIFVFMSGFVTLIWCLVLLRLFTLASRKRNSGHPGPGSKARPRTG